MKVKNFNMRGIPIAVPGGALAIGYTFWALATAFTASGPQVAAMLAGALLIYFTVVEAWRNRESTLEYDQIGVRLHSPIGWDVPWSEVDEVKVRDAMGDDFIVVVPTGPVEPSAPWGWFGTAFGVPRGSRIAPGGGVRKLKKYQKAAESTGPRVVSTSATFLRPWLGLLGAVGMVATFFGIAFGTVALPLLMPLGLLAAFGLAYGQAWRRNIAIVDAGGIRRVGIDNWTLTWKQIESARIVDDALIVRMNDEDDGPDQTEVQDSFQVDEQRRWRRPGAGLSKLRESLEADPDVRSVPIAKGDRVRVQQVVDQYVQAGSYQAPAAVASAEEYRESAAGQWPVYQGPETGGPVDLHEAEVRDEQR